VDDDEDCLMFIKDAIEPVAQTPSPGAPADVPCHVSEVGRAFGPDGPNSVVCVGPV
jgi:hypothetical protein